MCLDMRLNSALGPWCTVGSHLTPQEAAELFLNGMWPPGQLDVRSRWVWGEGGECTAGVWED